MDRAFWSEEQIERCLALWAEGKSLGVIADLLGLTRNAIAGRIYRMRRDGHKITERVLVKPERKRRKTAKYNSAAYSGHKPAPRPLFVEPAVPSGPLPALDLPLLELVDHACRYATATDESGRYLFCGQPSQAKSSFCRHHHAIVWHRT